MRRGWRAGALLALAVLLPAAAGTAATRTGEPSTAVAFKAPSGLDVTLTVQAADPDLICRDLEVGDETLRDEVCTEAPAIDADELTPVVVRVQGITVVYGTVRDATRGVDLIVDGRTRRLRTVAVDGFGPRFYATAFAGTRAQLGAVAVRDRARTVTAATDLERAALPLAGRPARLGRVETFDRERATLVALTPRLLVDPARSPTRRRPALCAATAQGGATAVQLCARRAKRVQVTYARGCKDPHITILGVAPKFVRRAVGVYADGRTKPLRTFRVPGAAGRRGTLLYGVREGRAPLRRVRVFDRDGEPLGAARVSPSACSD